MSKRLFMICSNFSGSSSKRHKVQEKTDQAAIDNRLGTIDINQLLNELHHEKPE